MKITHVKLCQFGAYNRYGKRLVTICAQLDKPDEFMTITVSVTNSPDHSSISAAGIARAQDFARQLADLPMDLFPMLSEKRASLFGASPANT